MREKHVWSESKRYLGGRLKWFFSKDNLTNHDWKQALHRLDQLTILPPEPLRWLSEQQIIYLLIRLFIWRAIILVGQTYCSFFDIQKVESLRSLYIVQAENRLALLTNIEYQIICVFDSNDCQTRNCCLVSRDPYSNRQCWLACLEQKRWQNSLIHMTPRLKWENTLKIFTCGAIENMGVDLSEWST